MAPDRAAETVFQTPWFDIVAKWDGQPEGGEPYYALRLVDFTCTIALTPKQEFVLVRQYRPAVERKTLELPAGHVDPGESPSDSAGRELAEETGYVGTRIESLGRLAPDTGRASNAMWCFLVPDAVPQGEPEPGIEVVLYSAAELAESIRGGEFDHALHLAALHLAAVTGKLPPWAN
jgi:ADP-ribose pyrophosphatase